MIRNAIFKTQIIYTFFKLYVVTSTIRAVIRTNETLATDNLLNSKWTAAKRILARCLSSGVATLSDSEQ